MKALYSYTYDYEGSKISFKCGDEFQLLAKVNNDWWHVRRWIDEGCAQDIYIPAVYVKEEGAEDINPLYQNMDELKKQVEEFKKKESSTPPPPTARKPRPGSDKNKAAGGVKVQIPSETSSEGTESVADIAKKLASSMQARKEGGEGGGVGSTSPLVAPKRSQSTRRLESPSSPRRRQKQTDGGGGNLLPVASKPRSYSINTRPTERRREKESVSPPELVLQHGEPPPAAKTGATSKGGKQPPPVLPKAGKLKRPNSMVMFSPTEPGEGGGSEDPFAGSFQTQLSEQVKKVRSVSSVTPGVGVESTTGQEKQKVCTVHVH